MESAFCVGSRGNRGLPDVLAHAGSPASHGWAPRSRQPPAKPRILFDPASAVRRVGVFCWCGSSSWFLGGQAAQMCRG